MVLLTCGLVLAFLLNFSFISCHMSQQWLWIWSLDFPECQYFWWKHYKFAGSSAMLCTAACQICQYSPTLICCHRSKGCDICRKYCKNTETQSGFVPSCSDVTLFIMLQVCTCFLRRWRDSLLDPDQQGWQWQCCHTEHSAWHSVQVGRVQHVCLLILYLINLHHVLVYQVLNMEWPGCFHLVALCFVTVSGFIASCYSSTRTVSSTIHRRPQPSTPTMNQICQKL